jgi:thymidylate synthase (FAD)
MKIVKPWIECEKFNGVKIMKRIERACRTCYRSEGSVTEDSYKKLLTNCINRGHESIFEHEKITVRILCDVGFYKDVTRHRVGTAFSIESTRYCNYSKDKFTNNIHFIEPVFSDDKAKYSIWKKAMRNLEKNYMEMAALENTTVDELRMLLPHSAAAEVTMTCNIREWKHVLTLRCSSHAHPSIQQSFIPLLLLFKKEMPEIFADVHYNEKFPVEKYSKIRWLKEVK